MSFRELTMIDVREVLRRMQAGQSARQLARDGVVDRKTASRYFEAARSCGLAAELNSSGWRKPCAEAYPAPALLDRFRKLGVPITTASDGHQLDLVSWRIGDLTAMARAAGYDEVTTFRARRPQSRPL